MDVSLYIPCYNTAAFLDKVIPAVMAQTYPIKEVLIIDDGSTDGTLEIAGRYINKTTYPLRIVRHGHNRGLSGARNTGFKEAHTEYVASLDGDCVPEPDWLEKLMRNFTDEKVAGVGGMLIETAIYTVADKWRKAHMSQDWGATRTINPQFLFGHSNVFKASAVKETGYYDERFRTNAEDYHMSLALYKAGYTLIYEPQAVTRHLKTDTVKSVLTAFWRYGQWGFQPSLKNTVIRAVSHSLACFRMLVSDMKNRNWPIMPITLLSPLLFSYYDCKTWFRKALNV